MIRPCFFKIINYLRLYILLIRTFYKKECYIGPFVGEFGHLLSHVLPFISFLNSKGIKVHYCGPKIHEAFFKDEEGDSIYKTYHELRDFYSEVSPRCNEPIYPADVQLEINKFKSNSKKHNSVYWNLLGDLDSYKENYSYYLDKSLYWNGFCTWIYHNKFLKVYKFKKHIEKDFYDKPNIVLFARKKGGYSPVRGDDWDFNELINHIEPYCNKITVLGHPAFSHIINEREKVKCLLTSDNEIILNECRKANFIINQLSGTHYLGVYLDTAVLLLMKGKYDESNVLKDSKYRKALNSKYDLNLIENYEQLLKTLKNYEKKSD